MTDQERDIPENGEYESINKDLYAYRLCKDETESKYRHRSMYIYFAIYIIPVTVVISIIVEFWTRFLDFWTELIITTIASIGLFVIFYTVADTIRERYLKTEVSNRCIKYRQNNQPQVKK